MSSTVPRLAPGRLTAKRIALLYLVFGFFALVVSDILLVAFVDDPLLARIQAGKGALEVAVTAVFIYLLVRWSQKNVRLQQRATDAAPIGVTMTDPDRADNPLIFVNDRFTEITGYDRTDAMGRNCRFLQGEETGEAARAELRAAVEERRPTSVDVVNYRKDGGKFWNKVDVAPVRNDDGEVTNFVGFQTDITQRKVREERLRVLNRLLRHNFRNRMTVIGGHAEMLEAEFEEPPESLVAIQRAVDDLRSLTETVRKNEQVLQAAADATATLRLEDHLGEVLGEARERHPEATIELALPDGATRVDCAGIVWAIEEAVDNAVVHNDAASPTVRVGVERAGGWVTVAVSDDGPGIPPSEVEVLQEGETALKHGNRLGIWTINWIVNLAGGTLAIETADLGGARVAMTVPEADE